MLSTGPGRIGSRASACSGVSSASLSGANRGLVSRISSLHRLSRALPSGYLSGPALIYLAINAGTGGAPRGWPVPVATDIAFAIAALAVAGPKLPPNLRVFLLTLAIVDDLGAVGLIGLLFTDHLRVMELLGALVALTGMGLLGRWRKAPYLFYLVGFVIVWGFTLKSGISTSLAGVAAAATIPLNPRK